MKIKRVYVECKRSSNFNTYTVGFDAEIEDTDPELTAGKVRELQAKARKLCNEQIDTDRGKKL